MQLYIGKLRESTEEKEVFEHFSGYGDISYVKLYSSFGFITADPETARKIMQDSHVINGSKVMIEPAKRRRSDRQGQYQRDKYGYDGAKKPPRLILENVPKGMDVEELGAFTASHGVHPEYLKILPSGDALVELASREERDRAIGQLNGKQLLDETVVARLGRRRGVPEKLPKEAEKAISE